MFKLKKILAIIDPTTDKQLALGRALRIGQQLDASVEVYICCYSPIETDHFLALKRVEIARHEAWIDRVIAAENIAGVKVSTHVEWREDWREALTNRAAASDYDLVVKAPFEHSESGRVMMKTSDWGVLRKAQCPVLFVKNAVSDALSRALVSINPKVQDEQHQRLNNDIVDIARLIKSVNPDVDLHALSAYTGSEPFTNPLELAEIVGVDVTKAHCNAGTPEEVIVDRAAQIGAELVILGTVSRHGVSSLARPNTAEKVLDRLEADVLVVTSRAA